MKRSRHTAERARRAPPPPAAAPAPAGAPSAGMRSLSAVRGWCIANGFHPNRTLGQNFLVDRNSLDAIADAARIVPGERILEIGPGLGALTETLLERGAKVFAVEKDRALAARLAASPPGPAGALETVQGDALDMARDGALDGFGKCVSNLPYSVGTRILLELAARPGAPRVFVLLVQAEVAARLAAGPGDRERGLAGVRIQLDYDVETVREIPASCFWPRPAVDSAVVRISRRGDAPRLGPAARAVFDSVVRTAFSHRRKQMGTIFRGVVQSAARPEELSLDDWIGLALHWPADFEHNGGNIR